MAEARWNKFLSRWSPENGEFEDAMQANLVAWAELEVERLQYLKQHNQPDFEVVSKKLRNLAADVD
jgi:hypothetical protein